MAPTNSVVTIVEPINCFPFILFSSFHFFNKNSVITTIVWFPFISFMFPSVSLTATPNLSQSGSVPITISAPILFAKSVAIFKASGSSGFGDFTVGKSPSGTLCSSTICTSVYPAFAKASGTETIEVPCKEVKTTFKFSLSILGDKEPFFTAAAINTSSTSLPMVSINASFAVNLISEKSKAFTFPIILPSCGGTICPPSAQYTL